MLKKAPKIVTIILSLVLFIFLVFIGYYYYAYKKLPFVKNKDLDTVLAVVGDEKITQRDLNERIFLKYKTGTPKNPDVNVPDEEKKELLGQLIEAKIIIKEAQKRNITASDEEINNKLEPFASYKEEREIWSLLWEDAKITVLKEKIQDHVLGWREGKYLFARFDRNLPGEARPNVDKNKYNQDKEYARKFIEAIYNDLKSNKITFDQAINKTLADNYLGESVYQSFIAGSFGKEEFLEKTGVLQDEQIYKKVLELGEGQMSNIEVGKVLSLEGEKEGFYFIVKIEKQGGSEAPSWEEWLSAKKKEYNVKIYADYAKDLAKQNVALAVTTSDCENDSYLGVHTGSPDDWAGLVIKTYFVWSSGSKSLVNVDNITVQNTNANEGIANLGNPSCGDYGCQKGSVTRYKERTFSSGSGYYCGSCRDDCTPAAHSKTGYLVLGKGYDSLKSGQTSGYRSYGNRYVLDCTQNNTASKFKVIPPKCYVVTIDDNTYNAFTNYNSPEFTVSNGYTTYINIDYYSNHNPNPTHVSPDDGASYSYGTTNVELKVKVTDPDNHKVKGGVNTVKFTPKNGGSSITKNYYNIDGADNYGWKDSDFKNSGTEFIFNLNAISDFVDANGKLKEGTYEWTVKGMDECRGFAYPTITRTFTIGTPTSPSPTPSPQGACTISGPTNGYTNNSLTFQVEKGCSIGTPSGGQWSVDGQDIGGATGTTFTYTFTTPGNHTVSYRFNCSNGSQPVTIFCSHTINIKEPWQYFWREVAPGQ